MYVTHIPLLLKYVEFGFGSLCATPTFMASKQQSTSKTRNKTNGQTQYKTSIRKYQIPHESLYLSLRLDSFLTFTKQYIAKTSITQEFQNNLTFSRISLKLPTADALDIMIVAPWKLIDWLLECIIFRTSTIIKCYPFKD